MIKMDLWNDNKPEEVAGASATFYPNAGEYRGNLYNRNGNIIGDYTADNSAEIEDRFPGIFG